MPSKRQLQLKDARKKKREKDATGAESAAAAPAALPAAAHEKKARRGRPKNKPSAEPLVRRDPDRICLDDGRAFLVGDFPRSSLLCCCSPLSFVCCAQMTQKSRAEAQWNKSLRFSTQCMCCLKRNSTVARTTAGEQGKAATTSQQRPQE